MALRTTALGFTVIITAALSSACSSAPNTGNQGQGTNSPFGGASQFGSGGGDTFSPGGTSSDGTGGFSSDGSGGQQNQGTGSGSNGFAGADNGGSNGFAGADNGGSIGFGGTDNGGSGNTGGVSPSGGSSNGGSVGTGPDPTSDSATNKGTCTVQTYTSGVASGQDYVNPTVYYPTDCPGPFAGVALIPGFTEVESAVNQWGTFLASHGIVVMAVDTAASGAANTLVTPPSRALGLYEAVTTLKGENTRSGSPLAGKLDTSRMAVMGHSMGGGGTMQAANDHSDLKAAIGLCPWNPGVTYPKDTVPSLFFDGTADTLVPPTAAIPEYNSIPTGTPKVYAEFNGGTHYVANTPLGGAATDKVVARIGLSWLEVHLLGDTRYQQFIVKDTATMSNWMP